MGSGSEAVGQSRRRWAPGGSGMNHLPCLKVNDDNDVVAMEPKIVDFEEVPGPYAARLLTKNAGPMLVRWRRGADWIAGRRGPASGAFKEGEIPRDASAGGRWGVTSTRAWRQRAKIAARVSRTIRSEARTRGLLTLRAAREDCWRGKAFSASSCSRMRARSTSSSATTPGGL